MDKIFSKLKDTLKYPVGGKETILRFLIGCVINYVPVFGNIVAAGYAMRGMKEVMTGKEGMPRWNDFVGLFLSGGKFLVALFIYGLAFFVPFALGMFLFVVIKSAWAVMLGFFIIMLGTILALSSAFIFPMVIIYMLKFDEKLNKIFSFSEVMLNIRRAAVPYTINVLIAWATILVFLFISYSFMSLKFGFLIAVIPLFYLFLIVTYIFGRLGAELGDVVIERVNIVEGDINK